MKKIPTLYLRTEDRRHVDTSKVNPACQWVLDGEGIPTRKFDGTCVMVDDDGYVWTRREVKSGKQPPPGFRLVEIDPMTGKQFGWEPYDQSGFRVQIEEALELGPFSPGTYELCGPKVNGNPENFIVHRLVRHGALVLPRWSPLTLLNECRKYGWEGVVWHHPDGRRAKLKVKDLP